MLPRKLQAQLHSLSFLRKIKDFYTKTLKIRANTKEKKKKCKVRLTNYKIMKVIWGWLFGCKIYQITRLMWMYEMNKWMDSLESKGSLHNKFTH